MADLTALKWKRSDIESALWDAGFDATDYRHEYVIRHMVSFQRHTDNVHECVAWAMARATNQAEQRLRRTSHGTGATLNDV